MLLKIHRTAMAGEPVTALAWCRRQNLELRRKWANGYDNSHQVRYFDRHHQFERDSQKPRHVTCLMDHILGKKLQLKKEKNFLLNGGQCTSEA